MTICSECAMPAVYQFASTDIANLTDHRPVCVLHMFEHIHANPTYWLEVQPIPATEQP